MRRLIVRFSESEASNHTPSLADFTTTTPELKFSVHTAAIIAGSATATPPTPSSPPPAITSAASSVGSVLCAKSSLLSLPRFRPFQLEDKILHGRLSQWEKYTSSPPYGMEPYTKSMCLFSGNSRMRLPVEAKMALASAGAAGGTGGSPMPRMALPLSVARTSITGVW